MPDAPGAVESKCIVHFNSNSSSLSLSLPSNVGGLANFKCEPGMGAGAANGTAGTGMGAGGSIGGAGGGINTCGVVCLGGPGIGGIKGARVGSAGGCTPPAIPAGKGV